MALNDRMYKEWPHIADRLQYAIAMGNRRLKEICVTIEKRQPLDPDEALKIKELYHARMIMESTLATYREAAQRLKRAENAILGRYPREARPGPFFYEGCILEVNDVDSDHEWRFTFTPAIEVKLPPEA